MSFPPTREELATLNSVRDAISKIRGRTGAAESRLAAALAAKDAAAARAERGKIEGLRREEALQRKLCGHQRRVVDTREGRTSWRCPDCGSFS